MDLPGETAALQGRTNGVLALAACARHLVCSNE